MPRHPSKFKFWTYLLLFKHCLKVWDFYQKALLLFFRKSVGSYTFTLCLFFIDVPKMQASLSYTLQYNWQMELFLGYFHRFRRFVRTSTTLIRVTLISCQTYWANCNYRGKARHKNDMIFIIWQYMSTWCHMRRSECAVACTGFAYKNWATNHYKRWK